MTVRASRPNRVDLEKCIAEEASWLFEQYGNRDYDGEPVSQTEHMVQCAQLARAAGADEELVLAAFLHDIGHLLKGAPDAERMGAYGIRDHEEAGAEWLKERGFSERVIAVVQGHVSAKRYLVATDPHYAEALSEASRQTLAWQGGPMDPQEAAAFEQHPFFADILSVRRWDEQAKVPGLPARTPDPFFECMEQHLKQRI